MEEFLDILRGKLSACFYFVNLSAVEVMLR